MCVELTVRRVGLPLNISNSNLQPKIVGPRFVFVRTIWNPENGLSFNISIGNLQRKGFGLRDNVVRGCYSPDDGLFLYIDSRS